MHSLGLPFLFTGADPFAVLLAALLADVLVMGISGAARLAELPSNTLRRAAAWFEARLNRKHRSRRSRIARGMFVTVLCLTVAAAVGAVLVWVVRHVPEGWLLEAAIVALLLNQRRTFDQLGQIIRALQDKRLDGARTTLAAMVTYDARPLDEHGVARGAAEACARTLCVGMLAPIFWYLLLGLPGLLAYRAVDSLAWVVGRPTPKLADFGRGAVSASRLMDAIPAALAGGFISLAAIFVPSAHPSRGFRALFRTPEPGLGWTIGALGGALGLALGGPVRYGDAAVSAPWIGDGRARATVQDVARARMILVVAGLLTAAAIALMELGATAA